MRRLDGPVYALSVGFWLLTSVYALLSSQPFAYEQFLKPELLPPLARFAEWHPWVNLAVFSLDLLVRWPRLGSVGQRANRRLPWVWGAISLALLVLPPLAVLGPGPVAPLLAGLALAPVALLLWAEWRTGAEQSRGADLDSAPTRRTNDDFFACLAAGVAATLLYAAVSQFAGTGVGIVSLSESGAGFSQSLLAHLLLSMATFCVLTLLRALAAFYLAAPRRVEAVLAGAALAGAGMLVVCSVILPGLSIREPAGRAVGTAFGLALALSVAVRGVSRSDPTGDGVTRVLGALVPRVVGSSALAFCVWLLGIGAVGATFAYAGTKMDWNGILSRLGVIITWLLLLAACLRALPPRSDRNPILLYLSAIAVLGVHSALASPLGERQAALLGVDLGQARRATLGADPSFRFLDEILQPPARADLAFVSMLQRHTNISRSLEVKPAELSLAQLEGEPAPYRPHVFLFVVDSLRRDYLSPYNAAVAFTPAIARFASDGVAFQNAFTRYGATGLSVPALWTGSPVLHKQYITPFAPMNTLAKLLAHEGYRQWIGMDNILDVILPESDLREPLDADYMVKDFRFCRTLEEIRGRLASGSGASAPVFAYTLPQDIHVSVVTREGAQSVDDADYPGFSAPVASRIRRFDSCFGEFLDFLRDAGLYQESLIVLTSDHGDSLGEEGRMGHAYGLFPEVIRIPLIVSLPERWRRSWQTDPAAPVYNTDLTPSLYRLLGHEILASSALFGRPLFLPEDQQAPRSEQGVMVASSYGAVYGALLDSATSLYIIDTVNLREHGYALGAGLLGEAIPVDARLRQRGQATIEETVRALANLHEFRAEP